MSAPLSNLLSMPILWAILFVSLSPASFAGNRASAVGTGEGTADSALPPLPTAALLPWYSNDEAMADYAWYRLSKCLGERRVFEVYRLAESRSAVEALGVDLEQYFGLEEDQYRALGRRLGSRYVMSGAFAIVQELTLSGLRKYATVRLYLHRSNNGERLAGFEIPYGMEAVPNPGGSDAERLTEQVMAKLCADIEVAARRAFQSLPPERGEHGLPEY